MPPERRSDRISRVEILPVDPLEDGFASAVAARVSAHIEAPCRRGDRPEAGRLLRWLPDRADQADADSLLLALEAMDSGDGTVLVGLTGADLAIPIFTFVFGRARHHGRAAVVSIARLRPEYYGLSADPDLLLRRAVDEVRHELGHVGGLHHCDNPACLLRFAATVEALDLRGGSLCPSCASALPPGLRAPAGPPR
jgi:predicted Zn-dependent protease